MMLLGGARELRPSPVATWLERRYDAFASTIVSRTGVAVAVFGVLLIAGLVALPFLDASMRPTMQERDVAVRLDAPHGTSLQRMDEITTQAVEEIRAVPGVADVGAHVGRAIQSDQIVNVNSAEVWVGIDEGADYEDAIDSIESVAQGLPDVSSEVSTYSEQRVSDVLGTSGDEVVVRIYGQDQSVLEIKAEEVTDAIAGIDGVENARVDLPPQEPTIEIQPSIAGAQRYGLAPGDVRRAATTLVSGLTVGNLFDEQKVFDVTVWGSPEIRETVADIEALKIDTPDGGLVALGEVADVRVAPNTAVIRHESVEPYVDVMASVAGRDVGAVAGDIERALEQVTFPLEHHAEVISGLDEEGTGSGPLAILLAAAVVVFLLLQSAFGSWRLAILSFLTLPTALAGCAIVALVGGGDVTLGTVAGTMAVLGLALRGVVVLIRRYQALQREGETFGTDLVSRGTRERVAPIVTSILASAAVFAPFAILSGSAGFELVGPMAAVVLGGLVTTTLLDLVVLPAAYLRFGFVAEPDASAEEMVVRIPDVDTVRG
jgi:Cu/Ag efflux pump CusA